MVLKPNCVRQLMEPTESSCCQSFEVSSRSELLIHIALLSPMASDCVDRLPNMLPHTLTEVFLFGTKESRYQGTGAITASGLRNLGWFCEGAGIRSFQRTAFHVVMSSPRHIFLLLERSWINFVCTKVEHRKWLGEDDSIFRMQLRHYDELSCEQQALVHFQSCCEEFTNDAKKDIGDVTPNCPSCEVAMDGRMHRFEDCVFSQPVRNESRSHQMLGPTPHANKGLFTLARTTIVWRFFALASPDSFCRFIQI